MNGGIHNHKKMKKQPPWSLWIINSVTLIFGFIPGLFIYGQNWIKLKKPIHGMIAMAFGIIFLVWIPIAIFRFNIPSPLFFFTGINVLFSIFFWFTQSKSLKSKKVSYSWIYPLLVGIISIGTLFGVLYIQVMNDSANQEAEKYKKIEALVSQKKYQEALPLIQEYYKKFKPYNILTPDTYRMMILTYQGTGKINQAIQINKEALNQYPNNFFLKAMLDSLNREKRIR